MTATASGATWGKANGLSQLSFLICEMGITILNLKG